MNDEAMTAQDTHEGGEVSAQEQAPKTYTEQEVQDLLQREVDRRITGAMKKAEKKSEQRVKEAEKLARMNEEERFKYELETREKAIAEKEKQLALAENRAEATKVLAQKGLDPSLADFILAEDGEEMFNNISALEKAFKQSVKQEVEKRLQSSTPKKSLPMDTNLTKEQFVKMPLSQQAKLARENPEVYERLTKR